MRAVWQTLVLVCGCGVVEGEPDWIDAAIVGDAGVADASPAPGSPDADPNGPTNCLEVQYCDAPENLFPGVATLCRKLTGCSEAEYVAECRDDAITVCGQLEEPHKIH
jgi:hypothetical protein